jgi:DNA-binding IclR family transcriptional regulator
MQQPDLISALLEQMQAETLKGRSIIPMAALCKRLDIRMSTLQRHLTALAEYGIVEVHCDDTGRWTALLTPAGLEYMATAQAA